MRTADRVYQSEDYPEIWVEAKTAEEAQVLADQWTDAEGLDRYVLIGLEPKAKLGREIMNHGRYRMYWHHADAWHFERPPYRPVTLARAALEGGSE
jgi:hypothetical protein